ncbi:hypothetical protein I79_020699 [Cricetulus griseus]|uniref:Uncharacterized protein n=1 Tax=Cricetulus griseus TaxID=10029 RepID=G3IAS0_CRIGR|nr:hypothetical protein I79_020699 [Cricetulus griseus]
MASLAHQNRRDSVGPCTLSPGSPDLPQQIIRKSLWQGHMMPQFSPSAEARQRRKCRLTQRDNTPPLLILPLTLSKLCFAKRF